jgi:hypothetical protein
MAGARRGGGGGTLAVGDRTGATGAPIAVPVRRPSLLRAPDVDAAVGPEASTGGDNRDGGAAGARSCRHRPPLGRRPEARHPVRRARGVPGTHCRPQQRDHAVQLDRVAAPEARHRGVSARPRNAQAGARGAAVQGPPPPLPASRAHVARAEPGVLGAAAWAVVSAAARVIATVPKAAAAI